MADLTVHRHGDRWAVSEARASSPVKEFETREAAESAARQLAAGGSVEVRDEDPTGLGAAQQPGDAEAEDTPRAPADGLRDRERLRTEQGGL